MTRADAPLRHSAAGLPLTARPMPTDLPRRTAPVGLVVGALGAIQQAVFPALAAAFGTGIGNDGILIGLMVAAAVIVISSGLSYLAWSRLTYTVGAEDIRVESGIVSRAARSVPYERIQDVSLEQQFVPRLLGLVSVKFETGAGGGEDVTLTYLTSAEGERLRQLVRERREEASADATAAVSGGDAGEAAAAAASAAHEPGEPLFAMGPRRLLVFGAFEFSLAVFAVLGGLLQYAETFLDLDIWDIDFWRELAAEQGGWILELGLYAQAIGAVLGLILVALIGLVTGMARTFAREWGFLLERTPRGFRRRRGLFTRTDVVMPIHRVQALGIDTQLIRYRFGWHALRFVSLAQDAGSQSHVVAPFAQLDELGPIVTAAGFRLPGEETQWHRASPASRAAGLIIDGALVLAIAAVAVTVVALNAPEWAGLGIAIALALCALNVAATLIAFRFKRHAIDERQIMVRSGILTPTSTIATCVKLHSVEITQGPIGRWQGYATLQLGLAGGELAIPDIPLERARELRARILATITATDFSQLERA